jgi:NAD(P)-dependent dehydrogenase (short-subunit alcohol dehydrogenase family)
MKKSPKVVLVAGAQGVIGRAAAEHFAKEAGTTVYGVSRRSIEGLENVTAISAIYSIRWRPERASAP